MEIENTIINNEYNEINDLEIRNLLMNDIGNEKISLDDIENDPICPDNEVLEKLIELIDSIQIVTNELYEKKKKLKKEKEEVLFEKITINKIKNENEKILNYAIKEQNSKLKFYEPIKVNPEYDFYYKRVYKGIQKQKHYLILIKNLYKFYIKYDNLDASIFDYLFVKNTGDVDFVNFLDENINILLKDGATFYGKSCLDNYYKKCSNESEIAKIDIREYLFYINKCKQESLPIVRQYLRVRPKLQIDNNYKRNINMNRQLNNIEGGCIETVYNTIKLNMKSTLIDKKTTKNLTFSYIKEFNTVFGENSKQEEINTEFIDIFNYCIKFDKPLTLMAYSFSGAGKSNTIVVGNDGNKEKNNNGILCVLLKLLFQLEYEIDCLFIETYVKYSLKNLINDFIYREGTKEIKDYIKIQDFDDFINKLNLVEKKLVFNNNGLNPKSSRSGFLIVIKATKMKKTLFFNIIDLPGREPAPVPSNIIPKDSALFKTISEERKFISNLISETTEDIKRLKKYHKEKKSNIFFGSKINKVIEESLKKGIIIFFTHLINSSNKAEQNSYIINSLPE